MNSMTSGMVAEKAAGLIKGVPPLPPSNAPFHIDEDWEHRQRPAPPARAIANRCEARSG